MTNKEILYNKFPMDKISEQEMKLLRQRGDQLKIKLKTTDIEGKQLVVLEFVLANEHYLIDSKYISEIIPLKVLTPLPCTPDFLQGITNIGGKIIAVISLKKILNLPEKPYTNVKKIILLRHQEIELAILTDNIIGARQIYLDRLNSSLPQLKGIQNDFITGITEDRLILLNIEKFMKSDLIIINDII
jgi:purine-binding chemotaxis protein CheW